MLDFSQNIFKYFINDNALLAKCVATSQYSCKVTSFVEHFPATSQGRPNLNSVCPEAVFLSSGSASQVGYLMHRSEARWLKNHALN